MDDTGKINFSDRDQVRLAVSPTEAARLAGVGRTTLYAALGSGASRSLKIGKRSLETLGMRQR